MPGILLPVSLAGDFVDGRGKRAEAGQSRQRRVSGGVHTPREVFLGGDSRAEMKGFLAQRCFWAEVGW